MTFCSQYGLVDATQLPAVPADGAQQNNPNTNGFGQTQAAGPEFVSVNLPHPPAPLAGLRSRAIFNEKKFKTKKTELLAQL